jgi:anti-sigma regulatory factor (Ser/Thr protein kinase)
VQAVSEAVVNAARHGLATSVNADITVSGSGLEVRVVDDGVGPRDGTPGLGSAYFSANSGGEWSLVAGSDGGSVFTVHLTA